MFKRILVPLDGSELAEYALKPALALAEQNQGEVILLQATAEIDVIVANYEGFGMVIPNLPVEEAQRQAETYLTEMQTRYAHPGVAIRTLTLEGDAAGAILDTAVAEEIDLIVMSTHGYSGFTRWVLGSVTERVLRHAPCPVLAVRSDAPITRIMITLDGSELAEASLEPGLELAKQLGAKVYLLRVDVDRAFQDMTSVEEMEKIEPGLGQHMVDGFYQKAETYLLSVMRRYATPDVEMKAIPYSDETAVTAILQQVEEHDIDLIVMSTHGRTGLRRWIYGSVTEKVLRSAEASMLIIRPPDDLLS